MAIQVRNSAEFKRLVEALVLELVDANIAFNMHMNLIEAHVQDRTRAMQESWTFWSLTIQGHLDSAIFRLCRIYDQKLTNLGLPGFLDTIECNQDLFLKRKYAERLQGRDNAPTLIEHFEPLNAPQLQTDIAYVTRDSNPTVDRLIDIRHNYYSHRNARDVVADVVIAEAYPHMRDEVGELLSNGLAIVCRYSLLFDANSYPGQIIGRSDYHYVLRAVQERIDRQRRER
jgi:AbiU2